MSIYLKCPPAGRQRAESSVPAASRYRHTPRTSGRPAPAGLPSWVRAFFINFLVVFDEIKNRLLSKAKHRLVCSHIIKGRTGRTLGFLLNLKFDDTPYLTAIIITVTRP